MSLSSPFIHRPVGTTLLTIAIALAGGLAYFLLPVSPLPQVEYPTINVSASLPGASPETMASSVATPLERQFARIAGVTEMTSVSALGTASVTLQFDLSRGIDAAARDVQAAINAAAGQLPSNLPNKPSYRKVNPADAPVMILTMTSDLYDRGRLYDIAATVLQQKLSQVEGVGQVTVGGAALPAVRVEVNPTKLNNLGLGLVDVRTALVSANANRPKGQIADERTSWTLAATDQLHNAAEYRRLIIASRNGAPIFLSDVATVEDSVEDVRNFGLFNDKIAVSLVLFRQPGANIIDTVDRVKELIPHLQASIPPSIDLAVVLDRTTTIRASVHDVNFALILSIGLVILVVFVFLRSPRTTLIPSVVVPISLIGTFGFMYLAGYSIDNLSLMALAIATGFVVDDAIVVIENITRYLEQGMSPKAAALKGASEIGFTVLSMSTSLVAVFIPILLMGGIVGRLFREFAVVLSVAIGISLIVSLTTTPMMCAVLLRPHQGRKHNIFYRISESIFNFILHFYERSLAMVLRHPFVTLMATAVTIAFSVYLYIIVPKGFFPQQDTGRLNGSIRADQDTSSQAMRSIMLEFTRVVANDPAVENVVASAGGGGGRGGSANTANMFVSLKPLEQRKESADAIIGRLRRQTARIPGADLSLQSVQDVRTGGRPADYQYQYTISDDDVAELNEWAPRILESISHLPGIAATRSDQQTRGLQATLTYDRDVASRLGLTPQDIDNALYDAFGQRQVSTMYTQLNQYHVVMEVDPQFSRDPSALRYVQVRSSTGNVIPLDTFAHYTSGNAPLSISHQGFFPAITISFNLTPGTSLGTAVDNVQKAERDMGLPASVHGSFTGTAQAYQSSLASQPLLIAAALAAVYIVLGMLYESLIHPITILSTLPSAGVGALMALIVTGGELNVMSFIGIILLIGIVKKNAIMMIDFALDAERREGLSPRDAIFRACLLRFRPIMMTTMAALFGGLPLALGQGVGAELRRPLGIAIVGGLIFSQALTLYTTPVIYLYLDRIRLALRGQSRPDATRLPRPTHA